MYPFILPYPYPDRYPSLWKTKIKKILINLSKLIWKKLIFILEKCKIKKSSKFIFNYNFSFYICFNTNILSQYILTKRIVLLLSLILFCLLFTLFLILLLILMNLIMLIALHINHLWLLLTLNIRYIYIIQLLFIRCILNICRINLILIWFICIRTYLCS